MGFQLVDFKLSKILSIATHSKAISRHLKYFQGSNSAVPLQITLKGMVDDKYLIPLRQQQSKR